MSQGRGSHRSPRVAQGSATTGNSNVLGVEIREEHSEVYLGFAEPGDQYLGRLLAGLLPNDSSFSCIPPHFIFGMENESIKEAIALPSNASDINAKLLQESYSIATNHLKANVCGFLWEKKKKNIENWTIGSWSLCTQRNYILKHGNESDKRNLPVETRFNAPHRTKRKFQKIS